MAGASGLSSGARQRLSCVPTFQFPRCSLLKRATQLLALISQGASLYFGFLFFRLWFFSTFCALCLPIPPNCVPWIPRYLGIQGTQFGGIGRHKAQKVEKNHNLKKRNPKYRDAPWLIKANNWVARFNREQRGNWKVGTHERRWRAPLESPDAPAIALRNAFPTSKVPLAKITRFK